MRDTQGEAVQEPPVPALLASLDDQSRRLLVSAAELLRLEPGQVLIELGAVVEHLYIIDDGLLCAEVPDRHGLPMELARFVRGDYCGEMAFLRGEAAAATVRAVRASGVWRVPHATLGDIADRHPAVMAEMAHLLAGRLAETNRRFRQLRPGHVELCLGDGPLAAAFLGQAVLSASRQLHNPVILLDLSDGPQVFGTVNLPGMADFVADPSRLAAAEAFGLQPGDAVGVITGEAAMAESLALARLLGEIRRMVQLVVVYLPSRCAGSVAGHEDLSAGLYLHVEGSPLLPAAAAVATMLLGEDVPDVRPGGLARYRHRTGRPVVRVVRGGLPEFEGERPRGEAAEPWASVDWAARHFLKRKVGLALGAGGSKGYAHLGVVETLRAIGVTVDYVAGSSIGAPIAAAAASGVSNEEVRSMLDATFSRAMTLTVPFHSLFSSRVLRRDMERYCRGRTFEQLRTPLAITAVDLHRRTSVVFRGGSIARAIVASMAIPGIFPPVRLQGRVLVDGGLLNPVPITTVAASGADVVIGVKLNNARVEAVRTRRTFRAPPIVDTIHNAFEVMQWKVLSEGSARADVTIEPLFEGPTGLRDFGRGDDFIAAGREAAEAARPALRELLPWVR